MDAFVERVRADSDIVAVVSSYVALKKKGNRYWGCCPFHHENTPSFSVVPEQGFFRLSRRRKRIQVPLAYREHPLFRGNQTAGGKAQYSFAAKREKCSGNRA